eukprot:scaffold3016_cov415-Prasinococcus_capsulatus_cf.AAC.2
MHTCAERGGVVLAVGKGARHNSERCNRQDLHGPLSGRRAAWEGIVNDSRCGSALCGHRTQRATHVVLREKVLQIRHVSLQRPDPASARVASLPRPQ